MIPKIKPVVQVSKTGFDEVAAFVVGLQCGCFEGLDLVKHAFTGMTDEKIDQIVVDKNKNMEAKLARDFLLNKLAEIERIMRGRQNT